MTEKLNIGTNTFKKGYNTCVLNVCEGTRMTVFPEPWLKIVVSVSGFLCQRKLEKLITSKI